jgi:hypothetical protein
LRVLRAQFSYGSGYLTGFIWVLSQDSAAVFRISPFTFLKRAISSPVHKFAQKPKPAAMRPKSVEKSNSEPPTGAEFAMGYYSW